MVLLLLSSLFSKFLTKHVLFPIPTAQHAMVFLFICAFAVNDVFAWIYVGLSWPFQFLSWAFQQLTVTYHLKEEMICCQKMLLNLVLYLSLFTRKTQKTKTIKRKVTRKHHLSRTWKCCLSNEPSLRLWPIAIEQNLIIPWCGCDRRSIWAISDSNRCRWEKDGTRSWWVENGAPFCIPKNEKWCIYIIYIEMS